jgi:hypothetical protein
VPDEGDARVLVEDGVGERDRLPIEQCVDDVRLDPPHLLPPGGKRDVLDVAEGEWADGVVPVRPVHPEPEKAVPPFLKARIRSAL